MTFPPAQRKPVRLDPEIEEFMRHLAREYAMRPSLEGASIADKRRITAEVRTGLRTGGPVMARTIELPVPFAGATLRVRLYYPDAATNKPALVYAHGGGWMLFGLDTHDRIMREYASSADVVVVGVEYSLAPEAKFPRALEETVEVVRWLNAHGPSVGIDTSRLAIAGDSAGANLALSACLALRDAGDTRLIKAILLNYGAFDSSVDTASHREFGAGEYLLATDEMVDFWQQYLPHPADSSNPLACPLRAALHSLPPAFLTIAEIDVLRDENIAMAARLKTAGVAVESRVYPGTVHCFLDALALADVSRRALSDASHWLRRTLYPSA